jgi:hypothetical protein
MIGTPTMFVLGAGASAPYGFPLGSALSDYDGSMGFKVPPSLSVSTSPIPRQPPSAPTQNQRAMDLVHEVH